MKIPIKIHAENMAKAQKQLVVIILFSLLFIATDTQGRLNLAEISLTCLKLHHGYDEEEKGELHPDACTQRSREITLQCFHK